MAVEVLAQTVVQARLVGYWFDQLGQGGQAGAGQQPRGGYGNLILSRKFRIEEAEHWSYFLSTGRSMLFRRSSTIDSALCLLVTPIDWFIAAKIMNTTIIPDSR